MIVQPRESQMSHRSFFATYALVLFCLRSEPGSRLRPSKSRSRVPEIYWSSDRIVIGNFINMHTSLDGVTSGFCKVGKYP